MHKAKRVEIIIEAPMESRLTAALEKAGVTGFTVGTVLDPARQALVFTAPEAKRVQVVDVADRGRHRHRRALGPYRR